MLSPITQHATRGVQCHKILRSAGKSPATRIRAVRSYHHNLRNRSTDYNWWGPVFITSGSPYPANPTPAPRVVHLNTPHFLSPHQNRLLHGTAAFMLLPFSIGALVHRSASASSMISYTALEPVHRRCRTRMLFPGIVFHGLGSASRKPTPSAEAPPSWTMN